MKKCPKCELNFINDAERMCDMCRRSMIPVQTQIHKEYLKVYFNETFTFKCGVYWYNGKQGYKAYNSKGEHVGIVFMTDDRRTVAYGYCELHFFPKYYKRYGEWYRIRSNGSRILWSFLSDYLKTHKEYQCFID